jgi:hypothetical protein
MDERFVDRTLWLFLGLGWLNMGGCDNTRPAASEDASHRPPTASSRFDPSTAETVRGQVTWEGTLPVVAGLRVRVNQPPGGLPQPKLIRDNPYRPVIDPGSRGIAHAVVYLRGIDPRVGKPWDRAPVIVEMHDRGFRIRQGGADAPVGFVRRGDLVTIVSRDAFFYSLHAGGAAFFTLAFPDPDQPLQRPLPEAGLVEITSDSGYYWSRANLFVDNHPYYTRTDAHGHFTLERVPPGRYELICWLPDWHIARHERDPESGQVTRLFFHPPVQRVMPITIDPGDVCIVDFLLRPRDFAGP